MSLNLAGTFLQLLKRMTGTGGFVKRIATETRNFINRFKPTSISASFPG